MSIIRWILIAFTGLRYVFGGIVRVPFGTAGKYYRSIGGKFGRQMMKRAGGKPTWSGLEKLDPSKSYVFVGNHQSYADIFLLFESLESRKMPILFMVKRELFNLPLFGTVAKHMGLIPVERDESRKALKSMMDAMKTIKDGHSLVIFPEGTRTKDGNLQPFKRGGFLLAEKTGMQIVPFVITGTANIIPRNGFPITPGPCHVSFLAPITPSDEGKELGSKVEKLIIEKYAQDKKIMDEMWANRK